MIDYRLVPYVGALPITFGMSPTEVAAIAGRPSAVGTTYPNPTEEQRGPIFVRYSPEDQKVLEIAFLPSAELTYQGVDLFGCDDRIGFLSKSDQPLAVVGVVVFLRLGITMTGFHDHDDSQKAIVAFARGGMDAFRADMKPL